MGESSDDLFNALSCSIMQSFNILAPLAWTVGEVLLNDRLIEEVSSMEVDDDDLNDTLLVHLMKLDRALWKGEKKFFRRIRERTLMRDRRTGKTIIKLFSGHLKSGTGSLSHWQIYDFVKRCI